MQLSLKAEIREKLGTSEARRIKNRHQIPAVIYNSKAANTNIIIDRKEFENEYLKGTALSSVFSINLNGKEIKAVPTEIELHPTSDNVVHVNFVPCVSGKEIVAQTKLEFINRDKSPGIKKGGFLHIVARRVKLSCANEQVIPQLISVDVGSMHIGQKIRAKDINLPEGVSFFKKDNFLIGSIIGRGKSDDEKVAAPVAATPAAAAPVAAAEKKPAAKK